MTVRSRRSSTQLIAQGLDLVLGSDIAGGNCGPAALNLTHCGWVRENRYRFFDRFEIVCAKQDHSWATVSGHGDSLVGGDDLIDDF